MKPKKDSYFKYNPWTKQYERAGKPFGRKRSYGDKPVTYNRKKLRPWYWVRRYVETGDMYVTYEGRRTRTHIICTWDDWCKYEYGFWKRLWLKTKLTVNPFEDIAIANI